MKDYTFLRLTVNNNHDKEMGDLHVVEQIESHVINKWMKNINIGYVIFWQRFQDIIVNSYVTYKRYIQHHMLVPMRHYMFQEEMANDFITGVLKHQYVVQRDIMINAKPNQT